MKTLTYQEEKTNNERIFMEMMQKIRPEIFVLTDLLDQTGVTPFILYKVIRQLNNIAIGSGYGKVEVVIVGGKAAYIAGTDTEKLTDVHVLEKKT